MKPREIRQTDAQDLVRSRLDQIIDMNHQLVKLAARVNWAKLEAVCGEAYRDGPGMSPLPTLDLPETVEGRLVLGCHFSLERDGRFIAQC